jgi:hypothetical protein
MFGTELYFEITGEESAIKLVIFKEEIRREHCKRRLGEST